MAKRFGGKHSPQPHDSAEPTQFDRARVSPVGARANLLFIPPVVLLFMSLGQGALSLVLGLAGSGVLGLAAWLLRGGLEAEAAYNERKVARRPALPRKMLASALTGIGVGLAVISHLNIADVISPILFGICAAALHLASFGIDPLKSKGMEGIDTFQQDRVARVVDDAEAYLDEMSDAMRRAGDRQMESRLERFKTTARDLIRTVEEDPRDLTAARKYLGVYLMGARDATAKFADVYSRTRDAKAREDYASLLDDLDQNFAARTQKLLVADRSDLAIEIDVLRDRLQREGVRIPNPEETS
ncbi:MAG: 5-bromo-4-chloroindolyl phosphate hydrolysis family protein [Pseudomonadota bacterium]